MNLLHIDSSVLGTQSASRELTDSVVRAWLHEHPGTRVVSRDLATTLTGHLSAAAVAALMMGAAPTAGVEDELAHYDILVDEFLAADVVVIGSPMYNFGIPSQLKTWLDAVARPGRTFKYTEQGPQGLAGGKQAIIVSTRGNVYSSGPRQAADHQEPHLRAVLQLMGVEDIAIVRAEGLNISPTSREEAMADAKQQIAELVAASVEKTRAVGA